jgi:hypothetical protein
MQFNSLQHKIWAERAGIIKEDWEQLITESYEYDEDDIAGLISISEEIQSILEALPKAAYVSAMRSASDPEGEGKVDSDKVVARAKKHHGEKFAKDLESGSNKMAFGRDNQSHGVDKLKQRTPTSVTKSGKADKRNIQTLKNKIKWDRDTK